MPTGDPKIFPNLPIGMEWTDNGRYITWTGTTTSDPLPITLGDGATIINTYSVDAEPQQVTLPKCYQCGKEVESISMYVKSNSLIFILKCHNDERRIDVSLKRFKDCKEDAIEWFTENFTWAFEEESKWRKVKPDMTVETVHADKKIITDWLDNL